MSLIKKYDSDFLLDQACLKALDDKGLLNKKPIRVGHQVREQNKSNYKKKIKCVCKQERR